MAFVSGFLPWVVYWALVGNVPFRVAVCVVLAVALATQALSRLRRAPWRSLEVGSLAVFAVLVVAAFVVDDAVLERWLQPLSNAGLLVVALGGLALGRPFVREYAVDSVDEVTARSDGFRVVTAAMTWLWVCVFAAMTVSSLIPPLLDGSATIRDAGDALSVVCYWVVPFALLGLGGLVSAAFPPWFERRSALVDRMAAASAPSLTAQPPPPPDAAVDGLVLDLPADSRHDEPFGPVVRGFPAGSTVQLCVAGHDLFGRQWRSAAGFTIPRSGLLDTAALAPRTGDWTEPDPDAALWAMRWATSGLTPDLFIPPVQPWSVTVEAVLDGVVLRRTVRRRAAGDGVRLVEVDVAGRPGVLAMPAGSPTGEGWPAVACFGGSEGGHESQVGHAALLASRGFAALAASWVDEVDGEVRIASVPLERFATAVRWLADQDTVDAARVAAMAVSRGAEGLLAASCAGLDLPVRGLVLISPSSVTWQAIGPGGEIPDTPSWTLGGAPTRWLPLPSGALMPQLVRNAWQVGRDAAAHRPTLLRLRPAYEAGLHALASHPDAGIAAERAGCALLCLTGLDDQVWPSAPMAAAILERHRAAGIPAATADEHIAYPGAGHLLRLGVLPTDAPWTAGIALGGDRASQAAAQRDVTARVPAFLHAVTSRDQPVRPAGSGRSCVPGRRKEQ